VLLECAGVTDAAVYGRPDPVLGEAVEARLVAAAGAPLLLSDVQRHCRRKLSSYKIPRRMEIVASIPRTLYGKIDRRALRQEANSDVSVRTR
jgi:fatty-acyl-CoA synthase/long-chain acyl-CoA synthetase